MKFTHKVSKGSSYNQIYIPREMETHFEVGDSVEVKLIKKSLPLHYNHLKESNLSEFKLKLISDIINELQHFEEIEQIFLIGSFLTNKIDYNDIDIMLITNKENNLEEKAYSLLTNKFNLKFHVISITKDKLAILTKICPLTRSMLYYSISNKKINLSNERKIDKNHIKFLLMMSEDILNINVSSRIFYDSLRRLIAIEMFLEDKEENPKEIESKLKTLLKENLFTHLKNNETIERKTINKLREIIREKLNKIKLITEK